MVSFQRWNRLWGIYTLLTGDLGHMNFGKFDYADASGLNLDSQVLAFKLSF